MTHLIVGAFVVVATLAVGSQDRAGSRGDIDEQIAASLRTGQYKDARVLIDRALETQPDGMLRNLRALFGAGRNMGMRRAAGSFACEVTDTGVVLPLIANGVRADWL